MNKSADLMNTIIDLDEQVKVRVVNPGILEVPDDKKVEDMPLSHFVKLAKSKGRKPITLALLNLQRFNKKRDPALSSWAEKMIDSLGKALEKEEK